MNLLSPNAEMSWRKRSCRYASRAGLSSLNVLAWRSCTTPTRLALLPSFVCRWSVDPSRCMIRRSVVMRSRMSGRCSLITASRPSGSTQAWTWPIDAAESGDSSKWRKICDGGRPEVLPDHLAGGLPVERAAPRRGSGGPRWTSGAGKMPGRRGDQLAELHERGAEDLEGVDGALGRDGGPRAPAAPEHLARQRLHEADGEGDVDDDHPAQLGDPELLEGGGLHVERPLGRPVGEGPPEVGDHPGSPEVGGGTAGRFGAGFRVHQVPILDISGVSCPTSAGNATGCGMAPRIPPLPAEGRDPRVAALLDPLRRPDGRELNIFATLARHPKLFKRWSAFGGVLLYGGTLPPRERELLILRTGYLCRAAYEWGQHVEIGKATGLSDDEIARWRPGPDAPGWSTDDADLLRAADELHHDQRISDATWSALADPLGRAAAHRDLHGRRPVPPGGLHAEQPGRASPSPADFPELPA